VIPVFSVGVAAGFLVESEFLNGKIMESTRIGSATRVLHHLVPGQEAAFIPVRSTL